MRAWVAIGSNLGDRVSACASAIRAIAGLPDTRLDRVSSLYLTEPVGLSGCEWFVNAVAEIETELEAGELLRALLRIEESHGRARGGERSPRVLDLDLLDAGGEQRQDPRCTLPHPRMHARRFTLAPLAEIAPGWRHPRLRATARELLDALDDPSRIVRIAALAGAGRPSRPSRPSRSDP
jgi:2-amino-4-hydroxy-6-hydroxymethyldihydropteridine diphosphokinase